MSATATVWTARRDGGSEERFDVQPAFPTQEARSGKPAAAPAQERPSPMLNSHRAWLDGLISAASGKLDA
ncbi:hypothetical protein [Streptomyces canus]|uniref:hypothetical protein n=1 Tax=Streptomyces canus TaxID=58343 RepID=UPI00225043E9|nr:hypothetical protein [Streptomyces canus]MCX4852993.1 hypothetical protein [Streptomyces canus]